MIDPQKFSFGTIDKGTKIHILPLLPAWGTGTACGIFHEARYIGIPLTIHDVDCQRCNKKPIYRVLLQEAEEAPQSSNKELPTRKGFSKKRLFPPQQEIYRWPRLVFDVKEEIRCSSSTVVVRIDALKKKYTGGVRAYVEKHGARCNRDLAVLCWRSSEGLDERSVNLKESGFSPGEDFEFFDTAVKLMEFDCLKNPWDNFGRRVEFEAEWLQGYIHKNGGIMIYHARE